ncbi:unnamed protein product [Darwinula stevensoni]|uniref:Uncharacterized protein n=1 Tax=Darwinula stevensoni TaxID=69355 RepID=A0A7R8XE31_9CRUS|nr:unnamed protein product [Darwinula stevensoni]CAG0890194.1 unnamed protein product [Darwinula stevensoni]
MHAGMTMRYNPNEGNGSRVEKIRALRKNGTTVNFVEVDPNDSKVNYMVVMPEALAAGKFCYYGLKSFKVGYAAIPLNETVSECVFNMAKKRKSLEWSVEGRILAEEPTTIWKEITSDPGKVVLGLMFGALLIFNLWYFVTRSDWWRRNCRRGQYGGETTGFAH